MFSIRTAFLSGACLVALTSAAIADEHKKEKPAMADWGYSGVQSAAHWGDLDKAYELCKKGEAQSPVNISAYMQQEMEPLKAAYGSSKLHIKNKGHGIAVKYDDGSKLMSGDKEYMLKHYTFHTPSEHYIDGTPYPMEVQFVHQADDGAFAILGVMIKIGAHNEAIDTLWSNIPKPGEHIMLEDVKVSAVDLLPRTGIYFRYDGSLTTPPCHEGVKWHVMQDPIEMSEKQLRAFQALFPNNARPIQPLNKRIVRGG